MPFHVLADASGFLTWYNAVFAACFGIGLFFTLLQLLGFGQSDFDTHAEVEPHADVDVHGDIDGHVDVHGGAEAHAGAGGHDVATAVEGHDGGHEHDLHAAHPGPLAAVAQFMGIGRVPMSAILMTLFYAVGLTGWILNSILAPRYASERALFTTSLAGALIVGLVAVRIVSGLLGRYMPAVLTSAQRRSQMVGLTGEAALPINDRFGRAAVRDRYGTLHQLNCKVPPGASPIAKGTRVVLTRYLEKEDMYYVSRAS